MRNKSWNLTKNKLLVKLVIWGSVCFSLYWLCHQITQTCQFSQLISFHRVRLKTKHRKKYNGEINFKTNFVAIKNFEMFWWISTENTIWRRGHSISLWMSARNKTGFLFCHFQYLFCLDIDLRCFSGYNGRFGKQKIMKPNIILIEVQ